MHETKELQGKATTDRDTYSRSWKLLRKLSLATALATAVPNFAVAQELNAATAATMASVASNRAGIKSTPNVVIRTVKAEPATREMPGIEMQISQNSVHVDNSPSVQPTRDVDYSSLRPRPLQSASGLSTLPSNAEFGNVIVNQSSVIPLKITNNTAGSVTISQVVLNGTAFGYTGPTNPTLAAGKSTIYKITFTPSNTIPYSGQFSITSNAPNSPLNIGLEGAGVNAHLVDLTWGMPTQPAGIVISGANIYRSYVSGGPYTLINPSLIPGTTYTDTAVQACQTYYYVATLKDTLNNESAYSNESPAVIPCP